MRWNWESDFCLIICMTAYSSDKVCRDSQFNFKTIRNCMSFAWCQQHGMLKPIWNMPEHSKNKPIIGSFPICEYIFYIFTVLHCFCTIHNCVSFIWFWVTFPNFFFINVFSLIASNSCRVIIQGHNLGQNAKKTLWILSAELS